ncbi:MAG TPA: glycosyltransferase family 4 protein [Candidatus Polarisedimenticolaceae bacterium]|nr:glycosyltransferase family 4 protein [Candidatus Polarisedimenticolaceae bacterium]
MMICYYFPPLRASGSSRSLHFSLRLAEMGWSPTILTVEDSKDSWTETGEVVPEGLTIVRTPEWNLSRTVDVLHGATRRLLKVAGVDLTRNYYRQMLCMPDPQIAWWSTARGLRLARECDAVYASCSPFSSAVSGALIKRLTGKPLVLDFRDTWYLNPNSNDIAPRESMIRRLERFAVSACDRLVVNTRGAESLYRRRYPEWGQKVVAIPNGYDRLDVAPKRSRSGRDPFVIMHVGTFYGSRGPDTLLEALAQLDDPTIEFVQVGAPFETKHLSNVTVKNAGNLPREEALELMKTASLLYLKQGWEEKVREYTAVAAKTYEYLATGLPILAECPPGDNADIVREYAADPYVVTSRNVADVKAAIVKARAESEDAAPKITAAFVRDFDRSRLTAKLAEVLDEVTQSC